MGHLQENREVYSHAFMLVYVSDHEEVDDTQEDAGDLLLSMCDLSQDE